MLDMLELDGYETVADEDGKQRYVMAEKDVFSYIGSAFVVPPPLPDLTEGLETVQSTPTEEPPQPGVVRTVSPVASVGKAESILKDFFKADHNKYRDVIKNLSTGGLSQEARALYEGLSKAARMKMLRCIDEPVPFRQAVQAVGESVCLPPDDALAEVVASKIVAASQRSGWTWRE